MFKGMESNTHAEEIRDIPISRHLPFSLLDSLRFFPQRLTTRASRVILLSPFHPLVYRNESLIPFRRLFFTLFAFKEPSNKSVNKLSQC